MTTEDLELVPVRTMWRQMGLSRSAAERRERSDPNFPVRISIGFGRWAYRRRDAERWINSLPTAPRSVVASAVPEAAA